MAAWTARNRWAEPWRLEALLFVLSSAHGLVRVFCSVVGAEAAIMGRREAKRSKRGRVGAQFVGDDPRRCEALLLEQLDHELLGRLGVAPGLNEKLEHLSLVVDRTPKPVPFPVNDHDHLVEMPVIAGPRTRASEIGGNLWTKLQEPPTDSLVGQVDAALGQHLFDVTKRKRKPGVEPDCVSE